MLSVRRWPADRRRCPASITGPIVASASLGTFGCTGRMTDPVRIRFAQAPQLCQKRGKVASLKQRLLAELNALEVASFDRFVERSATDTEQVKRLPDPVSCLRKTESTGVNRIVARVLVGASSWYCTAQVSENVYDTPTGKYRLIPQGARLIGQYDSQIAFGQSRVLLVWTRLLMPNGKSIVLERQPGADTSGYSGLEDEVDNHWPALFKAALLSTLLSVGSEAGTSGNQNDLVQAIRRGGSESFNQVGQRVVSRNLDIQPTLTIRPGFPVRVIVNRDLVLAPHQQEAAR